MIRIAKKEEANQIAPLIMQAIDEIALMLTGTNTYEQAYPIIESYVASECNRLGYKNCIVKEKEGKIAGVIVGYFIKDLPILDAEMLEIITANSRNSKVVVEKEAEDNDYYIDTVSVHSDYQGAGIGTELLKGVIDYAIKIGANRITLNVDQAKPAVRRLYERNGFEFERERLIMEHSYDYLVYKKKNSVKKDYKTAEV
ncbi:GNAT family N-acetyltransferase [Bacillus sp. RG28]|uniref:GNAT family N-acetyltransferase n=1 Tax=Gottfriedia endophytica TaxID=2820819 RepID=A0A940NHU4_9BACI|nr:GNAT family N-acetyltransferase [Gottfriedia endophytica]MBP0724317.1 GNAT family N-acetyltransferase [Gottfriedia endophytica]